MILNSFYKITIYIFFLLIHTHRLQNVKNISAFRVVRYVLLAKNRELGYSIIFNNSVIVYKRLLLVGRHRLDMHVNNASFWWVDLTLSIQAK